MVSTRTSRRRRTIDEISSSLVDPGEGTGVDIPSIGANFGTVAITTTNDGLGGNNNTIATVAETNDTANPSSRSSLPCTIVDEDGFLSLLVNEIRPKKKRKCRPPPPHKQINKPPLEQLPAEVLQNILGFVDNTRDLFHLVNTVKAFRRAIIPRPDIVVRTAVYSGGDSKTALESFFSDLRNKALHVPSTLRLLRVINGVSCERGEDCLHYDLKNKQSDKLPRDGLRPFGTAFCQLCFTDLAHNMKKGRLMNDFSEQGFLNHELLAVYQGSHGRALMLRQPFVDIATNESVGSLIPSYNVMQVANTYFYSCNPDMSKQQAYTSTERFLSSFADAARKEGQAKILSKPVDCPMGEDQVCEDNTSRLTEMIDAYDQAQKGYEKYKRDKKSLALAKRVGSYSREQKKKHQRKMKGGKHVLSVLLDLMEESEEEFPMGNYYLREFEWLFKCNFDDKGMGRFEVIIVDEILGPIVRAPTTASDPKMTAAIRNVLAKLELLEATGFLDDWSESGVSFLDSDCPCERAIEEYCRQFISSPELLKRSWSSAKRNFVHDIERGFLKSALYKSIHQGNFSTSEDTDLFYIFAGFVSTEYVNTDHDSFSNYFRLATHVWEGPRRSRYWWNFSTYKTDFLDLRQTYRGIVEKIQTYLMLDQTVQFLAEKDAPVERPDQVFTRQDAVDSIWKMEYSTQRLLEPRSHGELLELHRSMFLNPRKYGMNPFERPS